MDEVTVEKPKRKLPSMPGQTPPNPPPADGILPKKTKKAEKSVVGEKLVLKRPKQKKQSEINEFTSWLSGLGMTVKPSLHVNGANYSMAVVTVDFGTPLEEQPKLTVEQSAELVTKMKTITRALHKDKDVNVRVQSDSGNGVWWASIT